MSEHVHEELRRRFVVEVMPTGALEILIFSEEAMSVEAGAPGKTR